MLDELLGTLLGVGIAAERAVENKVESDPLESGDELASGDSASLKLEGVGDGNLGSWVNLDDVGLLGVLADALDDGGTLGLLSDGANWAVKGALAALNAGGLAELLAAGGLDALAVTALGDLQDLLAGNVLAGADATAADDALGWVDVDGLGGVVDRVWNRRVVVKGADTLAEGEITELAAVVGNAGGAALIVDVQELLEVITDGLGDALSLCFDGHAVGNLCHARIGEGLLAIDVPALDNAHST